MKPGGSDLSSSLLPPEIISRKKYQNCFRPQPLPPTQYFPIYTSQYFQRPEPQTIPILNNYDLIVRFGLLQQVTKKQENILSQQNPLVQNQNKPVEKIKRIRKIKRKNGKGNQKKQRKILQDSDQQLQKQIQQKQAQLLELLLKKRTKEKAL